MGHQYLVNDYSTSSSSGSLMKNNTEKQVAMNKNTLTIGKAFTQHGRINKTKHHPFHQIHPTFTQVPFCPSCSLEKKKKSG